MTESPLTHTPGAWADRHPVLVSVLLGMALAVFLIALASVASI